MNDTINYVEEGQKEGHVVIYRHGVEGVQERVKTSQCDLRDLLLIGCIVAYKLCTTYCVYFRPLKV